MKIVHCIFSFDTGGAETMLCNIIEKQSEKNDVSLIVVNNIYNEALLNTLPPNVRVFLIKRRPKSKMPWSVFKLNWLLRKLHPDIVHIHSSLLPKIIFGMKDRLWFTIHALNVPMTYTHGLKGALAISDAVRDNVKDKCKCPVTVVPNGIPAERITEKQDYILSDGFRIVQVAGLRHNEKGQDLLIRAVALLKNKGQSDIVVDFIGAGQSETMLKSLADELNVSDRIRFLGLKDRDYIYSHLKDYDLMCHPARFEGFGLVVAEGIAAGLPVLVSAADGPFEIIERGKYGSYFELGNINDLAEKISRLRADYPTAVTQALRAKEYVRQNYSVDRMVEKYYKAYKSE